MKRLVLFFITIFFIFPVEAKTSATDEYRVGSNDILDINVISYPELKTVATISVDGSITFPYLGNVSVKGKTISEIEADITRKLSEGYIKYPVVSVSLLKSISSKFLVYGEVLRSGEFLFEDGMTVTKAISVAGGISSNGYYGKIKIKRKERNKTEYKEIAGIKLNNGVIESGDAGDLLLRPDDIVMVERSKTFFIQGEVGKVGEFVLEKDMTIVRAISAAGGVTSSGLYGRVKIKRKQKNELEYKEIAEINLNNGAVESGEAGDMLLQPDDIVMVERSKKFFIQGDISRVGEFVLEENMTIVRAISAAGGVTQTGLYGRVKVKRKQRNEPEYKEIAETNLNNGAVESGEVGDMLLQPDDIVMVEHNRTFFIYGEVIKPGEYIIDENMTAFKAIILAGGFTKWGSPSKVKVLRSTNNNKEFITIKVNLDKVIEGDATADIILQPKDVVVVSSGIF